MKGIRRAAMIAGVFALGAAAPNARAAVTGNLKVEKTLLSPSPVHPGIPYTYQIVVTNLAGDATSVSMEDDLDMKTVFDSMTAPSGWLCGTPNPGQWGPVTCGAPTLSGGSSATFTITVTYSPQFSTPETSNSVTVSQELIDSDPTDNTSTVDTPVTPPASAVPVSTPALVLLGALVAAAGILIRR